MASPRTDNEVSSHGKQLHPPGTAATTSEKQLSGYSRRRIGFAKQTPCFSCPQILDYWGTPKPCADCGQVKLTHPEALCPGCSVLQTLPQSECGPWLSVGEHYASWIVWLALRCLHRETEGYWDQGQCCQHKGLGVGKPCLFTTNSPRTPWRILFTWVKTPHLYKEIFLGTACPAKQLIAGFKDHPQFMIALVSKTQLTWCDNMLRLWSFQKDQVKAALGKGTLRTRKGWLEHVALKIPHCSLEAKAKENLKQKPPVFWGKDQLCKACPPPFWQVTF